MAFQRKKPAAIGIKAPYPGFIEPALATSIDKVPSGERWLHEIKFDGYRVQIHLANNGVSGLSREGPRSLASADKLLANLSLHKRRGWQDAAALLDQRLPR